MPRFKHRNTPKGPANIKCTFGTGPDGVRLNTTLFGLRGIAGFTYHPTKGFRKNSSVDGRSSV